MLLHVSILNCKISVYSCVLFSSKYSVVRVIASTFVLYKPNS